VLFPSYFFKAPTDQANARVDNAMHRPIGQRSKPTRRQRLRLHAEGVQALASIADPKTVKEPVTMAPAVFEGCSRPNS
jgi:hypothetical protein